MNKNIKNFYDNKAHIYDIPFSAGSIYEKVSSHVKGNAKILDVGCGNANFSGYLKKIKKLHITGIELSEKMARNAKKRLDKVIVGNIEDDNFIIKQGKFDQILLMDILEHTFNPELVLRKVKTYLKKKGQILVTLPNIANWRVRADLLMGKFEYSESGILDNGHIRFFTSKTALKLFEQCGFEVEVSDRVCTFPNIILKLQNKLVFLKLTNLLSRLFPDLFTHQFLFVLKKR